MTTPVFLPVLRARRLRFRRVRRCTAWLAALSMALGSMRVASAAPVLETLWEFATEATAPTASLVQGADGNFYGSTRTGGVANVGTVFRVTPAGVRTTLVEFTGNGAINRGAEPLGALVQGSDGSFYGTTARGGASGNGTVFRLTPGAPVTTLVEFSGNGASNRGRYPSAGLARAADGNFYGSTSQGGAFGFGTLFRMSPDGMLTTLVDFTKDGAANRGAAPSASLTLGPDGSLYGTTSEGGATNSGTVFRVTLAGELTTLTEFAPTASNRGASPRGGVTLGLDGNFYGTTLYGGGNPTAAGYGTIFRLTPDGTLTTLVGFYYQGPYLGSDPYAGLVRGADGNFYGNTYFGGSVGYGSIFRITPAGEYTNLVSFTGGGSNRGARPQSALVAGNDGALYGVTPEGGALNAGTIFRVALDGTLTTLGEFAHAGESPQGPLALMPDGNFYGTTSRGGATGKGTVYRLTPAGAVTTLVEFTDSGATRGAYPSTAIVAGPDGSFYGTTVGGGGSGGAALGTAFRITPDGTFTSLLVFPGQGNYPSALALGPDGNFYGTMGNLGSFGYGTVFRLTPSGTHTYLLSFMGTSGASRGASPGSGGMVLGSDGSFYGTTSSGGAGNKGTVFRFSPTGGLTTLIDFTGASGPNRGAGPGKLTRGADGNLYAFTSSGGTAGGGTFFRLTEGGALTTLDDYAPSHANMVRSDLSLGRDGNIYGTTVYGGALDFGTAFRVTPSGEVKTLLEFTRRALPNLGAYPFSGLVPGADGKLYGAASSGGASEMGTVFRLRFEPDGPPSQLVSVAVEARGGTRVRWQGSAGQISRVEFSDALAGAWQPAAGGTLTAEPNGIVEYVDTAAPAPSKRFYRLVTPP